MFLVFTIPIPKVNSVSIFGIEILAGTPFSLKRGTLAPFLMHLSPLFEEYRSSRQIDQKRSSRQNVCKAKTLSHNTNQKYQPGVQLTCQYWPDSQYWYDIKH
jgi:hypothetical protein